MGGFLWAVLWPVTCGEHRCRRQQWSQLRRPTDPTRHSPRGSHREWPGAEKGDHDHDC